MIKIKIERTDFMDITGIYSMYMSSITPLLIISGFLALTISLIVMLVNMIIDAFTGKGFRIGLR